MRHALLIVALTMTSLVAAAESTLTIEEPWVREPNPARPVTAAYMTINNPTDDVVTVIGASSTAAEVVEIHEMKTVSGVMKMRMVDRLDVPAKSTVKLEPGGLHLMMIRLTGTLKDGDSVEIELKLEGGETMAVTVPVKKAEVHH